MWRLLMRIIHRQRKMRAADRMRYVLFIDRYLERRCK